MLKSLGQHLLRNKSLLVLLIAISLYLAITLPAIFHDNHVMKNLEPYPDGLLFSLSARNLAMGEGLGLFTNWGEVAFWVPPLYAWYLAIFYFISSNVMSFYLANLALGLGTIAVIYHIIKKTSKGLAPIIVGLLVYLSHLVVFWLPSLAMTENLSLFLFALLVLGLVETKIKSKLTLVFLAGVGLLLLRLSTLPILLIALLLLILQLRNKFSAHLKQMGFLSIVAVLAVIYLFQNGVFSELISTISISIFNPNFFNLKFIYPNFIYYFNSLFLNQGNFLWLKLGISSWPILGLFIYSTHKLLKLKKLNKAYLLIALLLSLFPMQLLFYTADSRYLIYAVILFSLAIAWLTNELKNVKLDRRKATFIFLTAIFLNIFFQRNLLKQIIADNWLGKSTAWQYEAILHFNNNLSEEKMIITALPPFLVDTYQTKNYRTLPLSQDQEFLQKGQLIWGEDVNYVDLMAGYKDWLEQGKELYISNAYITHQQSVIQDFEMFKEEFELELVSEGCQQACNIYKLKL